VGLLDAWSLEITTGAPEANTTTDAQGNYLFAFSNSGSHHIRPILDYRTMTTSPAGGAHDVTIATGDSLASRDFGVAPSAVLSRLLFYNQSSFDGHSPLAGAADDAAIAPDKAAYLAGDGTATFANISSYSRGINGIMVDLPSGHGPITASDFVLKVGTDNAPNTWSDAPAPVAVVVRSGAGASGSDRVELVWENGAIANTWLQVVVRGNDAAGGNHTNTNLPASDVFYFGSLIGDVGTGSDTLAITNVSDESAARGNLGAGASITNLFDFDRSGLVNTADVTATRNNLGTLAKIDLPAAPPAGLAAESQTAGRTVEPLATLAGWAQWAALDELDDEVLELLAARRT
jgi:hypothetical protein